VGACQGWRTSRDVWGIKNACVEPLRIYQCLIFSSCSLQIIGFLHHVWHVYKMLYSTFLSSFA
jgi:hypothetical protein